MVMKAYGGTGITSNARFICHCKSCYFLLKRKPITFHRLYPVLNSHFGRVPETNVGCQRHIHLHKHRLLYIVLIKTAFSFAELYRINFRAFGKWGSLDLRTLDAWRLQGYQNYAIAAFTTHSFLRRPQVHSAARWIQSTKNLKDPSWSEPSTFRLVTKC
jgi:hypothetical protein